MSAHRFALVQHNSGKDEGAFIGGQQGLAPTQHPPRTAGRDAVPLHFWMVADFTAGLASTSTLICLTANHGTNASQAAKHTPADNTDAGVAHGAMLLTSCESKSV